MERLTQSELDRFGAILRQSPQQLHYMTFGYDWLRKEYRLERGGTFAGYLRPLPPQRLRALGEGTFTDGQFNVIGRRRAPMGGVPHDITIASTPDGTMVVAGADVGAAPRVRFVVIERLLDVISVIAEAEALGDLPCIGRAARAGSPADLLRCLGGGSDQGSGGASGGGGGDMLGGFGSLLQEPDCKRDMLGRVTIRSGMRRTYKERMDDADQADRLADMYDRWADDEPKLDRQQAMRRAADAYELDAELTRELAEREAEEARVRDDPNSTEQERADAAARTAHARAKARSAEQNRNRAVEEQQRRGRTRSRPALGEGEPPPVEDPRCRGREVDAERGTVFMNPAFCAGADPLTCLRRQQDSIFSFFQGQCWTETGPDDAPRIVCAPDDGEPGRPDAEGGAEPPDCESQDIDCWTDPVAPRGPRGRTNLRYVDVTPMGAFLLGLCARGGCPRPAP